MNNLRKEYYEFGPWLTEIKGEEDITHQFTCLKDEILASELAVKIPVDKEWRQVKEGELLYDTVVTVDREGLGCYRIIDESAYSCKMSFGDIVSIHMKEDILSCDMVVATSAERLHFGYIPIPIDTSEKFIELVKTGYQNHQQGIH